MCVCACVRAIVDLAAVDDEYIEYPLTRVTDYADGDLFLYWRLYRNSSVNIALQPIRHAAVQINSGRVSDGRVGVTTIRIDAECCLTIGYFTLKNLRT